MIKIFIIISLAIGCCHTQLAIPRRTFNFAQPTLAFPPLPGAPIATKTPFAVAPAVVPIATTHPHIQKVFSQEILPVQELPEGGLPVLTQRAGPQVVRVNVDDVPVVVHFQTHSQRVHVEQSHLPSEQGEVTITRTEDQPHRVIHEVIRPIIQEIREIIQPYRRVTQEVRPVEESVHTTVAQGQGVAVPAPAVAVAKPAHLAPVAPVIASAQVVPAQVVPAQFADSYLQNIIAQFRARVRPQPQFVFQNPVHHLPAPTVVAPAAPIAAPALPVSHSRGLIARGTTGGFHITRKFVES